MKPNEVQLELIKEYLQKYLNYRETYMEAYDHILTALEAYPDDVLFGHAMNNIVRDDFGGIKGLKAMEWAQQKATLNETMRKYQHTFSRYFTFPTIGIITIGTVLLYLLVKILGIELSAILMILTRGVSIPFFAYAGFQNAKRKKADTPKKYLKAMFGSITAIGLIILGYLYAPFTFSHPYFLLLMIIPLLIDNKIIIAKWTEKVTVKPLYVKYALAAFIFIPFLMILLYGSACSLSDNFRRVTQMWYKHNSAGFTTGFILLLVLHVITISRMYININKQTALQVS